MFSFLKDKIKKAVDSVSEKFKKEEEIPVVEEIKEKPKKKLKEEAKKKIEEKKKEIQEEIKRENLQDEIQEKGFLKKLSEKITTRKISEEKFESLFSELEMALLENNVALEVIDKIKEDMKIDLVDTPLSRGNIEDQIKNSLKNSISDLFEKSFDILDKMNKKPYVICFVGINGSGKTTNLAKVANYLQKNKKTCIFSASDTFRAAAIQQLEIHGKKLGVKVIKHNYGSDPAAVAYDAIEYAKKHKIDAVLIDTSGRLHSNENLMAELKKIIRISNPDLTIFVGEAITGNDAVEQAKTFNEQIGLDGIILSKQDIDEKGGTAISIGYITKLPILFIGCGQGIDDLEAFNKDKILQQLGLE